MSTFINNIVDEETVTCEVCKETFDAEQITTDDFNFAWDNLVATDCCSSCFSKVSLGV